VGPVFAVEEFFAEAGDGAHAGPCGGVGWAGEDHAVVEEDCVDWSHDFFIVRDAFRAEGVLCGALQHAPFQDNSARL
jgi:hypothetical protein